MTDTPETDNLARGNHVVPTEFAQDLERQLSSARTMVHKLRRERAVARQFGEQMECERDKLKQALKAILFFCEEDQQFASKPYRATFLHAEKLVTRHSSPATSP